MGGWQRNNMQATNECMKAVKLSPRATLTMHSVNAERYSLMFLFVNQVPCFDGYCFMHTCDYAWQVAEYKCSWDEIILLLPEKYLQAKIPNHAARRTFKGTRIVEVVQSDLDLVIRCNIFLAFLATKPTIKRLLIFLASVWQTWFLRVVHLQLIQISLELVVRWGNDDICEYVCNRTVTNVLNFR